MVRQLVYPCWRVCTKYFECWSDFLLELVCQNHYQTPRTGWDVCHTIIPSPLGVEEVLLRSLWGHWGSPVERMKKTESFHSFGNVPMAWEMRLLTGHPKSHRIGTLCYSHLHWNCTPYVKDSSSAGHGNKLVTQESFLSSYQE